MYKLDVLPYSLWELEPFIDIHTMGLHYYKHYKNYLNKLNDSLNTYNYDFRYTLEELVFHINEFGQEDHENILYNLGGLLNHNLYWKSINGNKVLPTGKLKDSIDKKYGDFENFWKIFRDKALSLKGAGYTVLGISKDGELDITNIYNQDIPLCLGIIPLFIVDMWEHAYYINYENERKRYLDNFLEIVDFTYASNIFNSIVK